MDKLNQKGLKNTLSYSKSIKIQKYPFIIKYREYHKLLVPSIYGWEKNNFNINLTQYKNKNNLNYIKKRINYLMKSKIEYKIEQNFSYTLYTQHIVSNIIICTRLQRNE